MVSLPPVPPVNLSVVGINCDGRLIMYRGWVRDADWRVVASWQGTILKHNEMKKQNRIAK
jgi:hypothetical protein